MWRASKLPASSDSWRCPASRPLAFRPSCHTCSKMGEPWEESEVPPGPGKIFGLNDENEMFHARLIKWVRVPSEIPFRQAINRGQIGTFPDPAVLPPNLKGPIQVDYFHNGK